MRFIERKREATGAAPAPAGALAPLLPRSRAARRRAGQRVTLTHVIIKTMGLILKELPSVNGHIVFGKYYPAPTADVGCLVVLEGGKNLALTKVRSADGKRVEGIAQELQALATKLRTGKDKVRNDCCAMTAVQ